MKRILNLSYILLVFLSSASFANQDTNQKIKCLQSVNIVRPFDFIPDIIIVPHSENIAAEGYDYQQVQNDLSAKVEMAISKCIMHKSEWFHSEDYLACKESSITCKQIN